MTSKVKSQLTTLDQLLQPLLITCGKCGNTMQVYPSSENGIGYCPTCSPAWLESFAIFGMNQLRIKLGLSPI